jgi:solute carrier family 25 protein 34/35
VTGRVRGALYTNPIDCLWKTYKVEGVRGWYKGTFRPIRSGFDANVRVCIGTVAHFFRIFPHTVITLVANEVSTVDCNILRNH